MRPVRDCRSGRRLPCGYGHVGDIGRRRRLAGPDRPDRLIGDDGVGGGGAGRDRARDLDPTTSSALPASRCSSVSPTQTIDPDRPGMRGGAALAETSASSSPWFWRRSEWPTMTCAARIGQHHGADVAGIGTRLRHVAVLTADSQGVPATASATAWTSVAGGQTSMSNLTAGGAEPSRQILRQFQPGGEARSSSSFRLSACGARTWAPSRSSIAVYVKGTV